MARLEGQVALTNMVRSTKDRDVELLCMLCAEEDWTESLLVFLKLHFFPDYSWN